MREQSESSFGDSDRENVEKGTIKCVVIGDGTVGKTSLLQTFSTNKFPTQYVPTVFDNYVVDLAINGKNYTLALFDTAGQEGFEQLRSVSYQNTDVFLVCFSTVYHSSLTNVSNKWIPEIRKHCSRTPFILVATKIDLRNDNSEVEKLAKKKLRPIASDEGAKVAKQLKAYKYVECSALTQQGLKDVFDEAIFASINQPKQKKSKQCLIL